MSEKLPAAVAKKLGYYVYLYVDPQTDEIFYVGKGKDNRAFDHLTDSKDSEKTRRIREIIARGQYPRIEILAHGFSTEKEALAVESAVIDAIGSRRLTNAVRGWHSGNYGRMRLDQIVAQYSAGEADIVHAVVLIRINRLFRYGLKPIELYDITRGLWKVGPQREQAELAFAIFDGVVQEVYRIASWFPAGATLSTRDHDLRDDRFEFVGTVAEEQIRRRYLQKSVRSYFPQGSQNPIRYVNV